MEPGTRMPTVTVSAENVRGLTAAMAGWDKWLAEQAVGPGLRLDTERRSPQGNPGLRGCSGHSDPSSEAPDPTWPLRFLPELQTTPLAEFWGCTSPYAER